MKPCIPVAEVRAMLSYDPATGEFRWFRGFRRLAMRAGSVKKDGYRYIAMKGKRRYLAHRIAWALVTGEWPDRQIDHINGIRGDNRFVNLRLATNSENMRNRPMVRSNQTGFKGVSRTPIGRFSAKIGVNGKSFYLGTFDTAEAAATAYAAASVKHHGEFRNCESGPRPDYYKQPWARPRRQHPNSQESSP
jgi:hypothetical protein